MGKLLLKSEPNFYRMPSLPMPSCNNNNTEMPRTVKYQEDEDMKSDMSDSTFESENDYDISMKDLLQEFKIDDDLEKQFMNEIHTKETELQFVPHLKLNT